MIEALSWLEMTFLFTGIGFFLVLSFGEIRRWPEFNTEEDAEEDAEAKK